MIKIMKYITTISIILCVILIGASVLINNYVKSSTQKYIFDVKASKELENVDAIVVLGAGVWKTGPSPILRDRLDKAIELYNEGVSKKIIMSGDHGKKNYDEVNAMKDYAIEKGIPSEDIFMDHAGFSTYETMYRARDIFKTKKIVIVTQEYHMYRAIYIARKLGLDAFGVSAMKINYSGQQNRDIREFLARNKDFFKCIFRPKPTYLGEEIPVVGNGNITNDK